MEIEVKAEICPSKDVLKPTKFIFFYNKLPDI